jgi:hypothetical protein
LYICTQDGRFVASRALRIAGEKKKKSAKQKVSIGCNCSYLYLQSGANKEEEKKGQAVTDHNQFYSCDLLAFQYSPQSALFFLAVAFERLCDRLASQSNAKEFFSSKLPG